ncbi:MAG: outer membrane lipoprotein-sorting protein [Deltaproteobacteria bacterium]|nr:outer membrane lipoprotein-sorting protein [Deltaproteobacteria bacterium]MBW2086700.1 outer membrane lipoprotein-sorting protein [Deltaproteobacteria bacterium]
MKQGTVRFGPVFLNLDFRTLKGIKSAACFCVCLLSFLCFGSMVLAQTAGLAPKEILDRVDDLMRGDSSHGKMTMTITTAHWTRSLRIEAWSKGKDKSLMRILAPKKEKGTATLRSGNNIWNFLPKVKRIIKLPSSMMASSWMGSHFTNDDLVKESRMADDYDFKATFEGVKSGREVLEITCIPKEEAVVVWGKVVLTVGKDNYLPLKIEYYDEDLELARTMTFEDVGLLGGRTLPRRFITVPADKPQESTVITYEEMAFNLELDDKLFSIRSLQR